MFSHEVLIRFNSTFNHRCCGGRSPDCRVLPVIALIPLVWDGFEALLLVVLLLA